MNCLDFEVKKVEGQDRAGTKYGKKNPMFKFQKSGPIWQKHTSQWFAVEEHLVG